MFIEWSEELDVEKTEIGEGSKEYTILEAKGRLHI